MYGRDANLGKELLVEGLGAILGRLIEVSQKRKAIELVLDCQPDKRTTQSWCHRMGKKKCSRESEEQHQTMTQALNAKHHQVGPLT